MKRVKFMDLDLFVPPDVFTPRPETELLVNVSLFALWLKGGYKGDTQILDIGTGSGNIAISLTKFNKHCKLISLDIRDEALKTAKANAELNGVFGRIQFIKSDLFNALPDKFLASFDCIVSNPPYVPKWEIKTLSGFVQDEPRAAIDGGEDGLNFYRKIIKNAPSYLKEGGWLVMEIGYNQSYFVRELLEKQEGFMDPEMYRDDQGIDRIIKVRYG